jgi:heat shock protein HtpX
MAMTALVQDVLPKASKPSGNSIQCAVLLTALFGGLCLTAWSLAGLAGLAIGLLTAAVVLIFDPKVPGFSVLDLYGAEKHGSETSQISSLIDVLSYRAGLVERPDLYVIPSLTLIAFSVATKARPAIAITEGLLRRLTLRETAGIIAHEIAHIRNGDLKVFRFSDWLARLSPLMAIAGLCLALANLIAVSVDEQVAPWGAVAVLYFAPALTSLLLMTLSHAREEDADAQAADLTGDPMALASALQHMESSSGSLSDDFRLPVAGRRVPYPSLLRAHTPHKTRIARLLSHPSALAPAQAFEPLVIVEQPMVSLVGYGPGDMRPRTRWSGLWF